MIIVVVVMVVAISVVIIYSCKVGSAATGQHQGGVLCGQRHTQGSRDH